MLVNSSNVREIDHDPERQVLWVTFNTGAVYEYSGVSREVANAVMSASSVGSALNSIIKQGGYPYTRVG